MFFKKPELTSGSRPDLLSDETLLFVQDGVGLYEGKFKIAACQNGHAYLTSHRIVYVDDTDARKNSLSIDLRDVERHDYQAKFLRSSPKITMHPKPIKRDLGLHQRPLSSLQRVQTSASSPTSRTGSPFRPLPLPGTSRPTINGNWICPICSFNNPLPSNFDPGTANESFPLPPCLTCGIKPPFTHILKAAISVSSHRPTLVEQPPRQSTDGRIESGDGLLSSSEDESICPRCTFHNHPSLKHCEICGATLSSATHPDHISTTDIRFRPESPGPEIADLSLITGAEIPSAKLSFRSGGEKIFYERLKNALVQRKWLASIAPPVPRPLDNVRNIEQGESGGQTADTSRRTGVGIAGLERRGLKSREANQTVIGTAFEDLEALMASAKEVVALAEQFSSEAGSNLPGTSTDVLLSQSATAVGMVATRDLVSDTTNKLYLSELSRNLAEEIEKRGLLTREGGIVSLVNLWAQFNRAQNGVELISPSDFHKAAELWATLNMPIRLRRFKSGLLAVQQRDRTDDKTIAQMTAWLKELQHGSADDFEGSLLAFGRGVTAQDAAQRFGWNLGVASEELEMAEEKGALCRDEGIEGLKFWLNHLVDE